MRNASVLQAVSSVATWLRTPLSHYHCLNGKWILQAKPMSSAFTTTTVLLPDKFDHCSTWKILSISDVLTYTDITSFLNLQTRNKKIHWALKSLGRATDPGTSEIWCEIKIQLVCLLGVRIVKLSIQIGSQKPNLPSTIPETFYLGTSMEALQKTSRIIDLRFSLVPLYVVLCNSL